MTNRRPQDESMAESESPKATTAADGVEPRMPLGQWLIENMPRGTNLEVPSRRERDRKIPFVDDEEWT